MKKIKKKCGKFLISEKNNGNFCRFILEMPIQQNKDMKVRKNIFQDDKVNQHLIVCKNTFLMTFFSVTLVSRSDV